MKNELQRIVLMVAAVAVGAIVFSFLWAKSHRDALVKTLGFDLKGVYQRVVAENHEHQPVVVGRQAIVDAFSLKPGEKPAVSSFVTADQIYLPREPVPMPSDLLLCVVDMGGGHYFGISGRGKFRAVPSNEMKSWAHEPLPRDVGQRPEKIGNQ